jgi:hypothetical protein
MTLRRPEDRGRETRQVRVEVREEIKVEVREKARLLRRLR